MDCDVMERLEAIDRLVKMLSDERESIARQIKPSDERDKMLKSIAEAIIKSGFNRESVQSEKWAGIIVMNATLGRARMDDESKQQAKLVLREIVSAGHLKMASEYSTRRGRGLPVYVLP